MHVTAGLQAGHDPCDSSGAHRDQPVTEESKPHHLICGAEAGICEPVI